MELAQSIDTTNPSTISSSLGLGLTELLWIALIAAAVILLFWAFSKDRRSTSAGIKGGKVKRTITEYEDIDDDVNLR